MHGVQRLTETYGISWKKKKTAVCKTLILETGWADVLFTNYSFKHYKLKWQWINSNNVVKKLNPCPPPPPASKSSSSSNTTFSTTPIPPASCDTAVNLMSWDSEPSHRGEVLKIDSYLCQHGVNLFGWTECNHDIMKQRKNLSSLKKIFPPVFTVTHPVFR